MCKTPEDLDLNGIDTVALDIETYDPNLKTKGLGAVRGDGFITGVAVATGQDTVYFPLHHSDHVKSDSEKKNFWDQMNKKILQNPNITKVFHNAIYDVCWMRAETGKMLKGRIVDTMVAASVIDENRFKYSLDALAKDILKDEKYKYDLQEKTFQWSGGMQKDPMSNMHKLPSHVVKEYAKQDVNLTLRLWNIFDKKLDKVLHTKKNGEQKTCRKIFELETKLFPCLVDMKFKGVRIDTHVYSGYSVPPFYDSLLAKLITYDKTRELAIEKMYQALSETVVQGVKTNIELHKKLLRTDFFTSGKYSINTLTEYIKNN